MNFSLLARRSSRLIFRSAAVACAILMAWLAFRPAVEVAGGLPWDKANHALAYLTLTVFTRLGWPTLRVAALLALMLVSGIVIEVVQGLPAIGRDADAMDIVADGFGAAAGLLFLAVLRRRDRR